MHIFMVSLGYVNGTQPSIEGTFRSFADALECAEYIKDREDAYRASRNVPASPWELDIGIGCNKRNLWTSDELEVEILQYPVTNWQQWIKKAKKAEAKDDFVDDRVYAPSSPSYNPTSPSYMPTSPAHSERPSAE